MYICMKFSLVELPSLVLRRWLGSLKLHGGTFLRDACQAHLGGGVKDEDVWCVSLQRPDMQVPIGVQRAFGSKLCGTEKPPFRAGLSTAAPEIASNVAHALYAIVCGSPCLCSGA